MKCTQCHNDFDEFYTFCPHCGKEREQAPPEKVIVSNESSYFIHPVEIERNATYQANIAFLRKFCSSSKMLVIILLLTASVLYSIIQLILELANPSDPSSGLGLFQGASILSIISIIISALPLVGLSVVYTQAKRQDALTGSGFHLISKFALINIWLYRIAFALLALLAMVFVVRARSFFILVAYTPFLLIVPTYLLFLATREFCDLIADAIDSDEKAILPYPNRVQRWLKWLTKESGLFVVFSILFVYVIDTPEQWAEPIGMLQDSILIVLLHTVIFGYGWNFVNTYGDQLLKRRNY